VFASEATPVLRYPTSSWEELQRTWAPNVGHQIRRRSRQLEREIGLSYRLTTEREELTRDMDTLFALHLAPRGGQTTHFAASHQRFHRDFAGSAFERGWLRLLFLELGGHAAAAIYGFRFADSESFYQSGRDPGWNHRSVGMLVLAELIRQAQRAGMREFRFLRGDEAYKFRFANADPGLQTIALARGRLRAPVLMAAVAVRRSVVRPLRRRLGR
jgi:CelD/BcsL family acetyltransferase involved in cellulose biosynthesis